MPSPFDPVEGAQIRGRYRLGRLLGRGATAEVRLAHDVVLERDVAVKLLHHGVDEALEARTRFVLEAQLTAQLSSPHAVAVYDFGEVEGTPFLVMERMSGRTWADELRAGRPADDRVATVLHAVAAALDSAHESGIWHRDVKPANIMLADDGSAKLGDFGIAKSVSGGEVTRTGDVVGSFAYVAPERASAAPSGPAADVWAFGVVAYESYAGRRPFDGDSPLAVVHAVLAGTHEPLAALRPDLDPTTCALVTACLAADPELRPGTAALVAALTSSVPAVEAPVPVPAPAAVPAATVDDDVPTGAMTAPVRPPVARPRRWGTVTRRFALPALAAAAVIGAAAFAASATPDAPTGPGPVVTLTVTRTVAPAATPSARP